MLVIFIIQNFYNGPKLSEDDSRCFSSQTSLFVWKGDKFIFAVFQFSIWLFLQESWLLCYNNKQQALLSSFTLPLSLNKYNVYFESSY